MNKWVATFIGCLVITGCSSSDDSSVPKSGPDISSYFDEPGEAITYNDHLQATYYDVMLTEIGSVTQDSVTKEYYGQVSSIPKKYEYTGDIPAPYTLCITTEDDDIDGFEYNSMQDEEIVDDNLKTFTRIDAQTKTGSEEPGNVENISVGDQYTYSENSTLFDSTSAQEVGSEVVSGTFTVESLEMVSVSAGNFNAIKVSFEMNVTTTLHNISDTSSFVGDSWFDATTVLPLKLTGTLDTTLNQEQQGVTATVTLTKDLADYQPAPGSTNGSTNVLAMQLTTVPTALTRAAVVKQILQAHPGLQIK
jgi:hypothetical protein